MVPSSGRSRPATSRSVVDFPHPDGPISVSNSPGAASSRSESAATTPPYDLLTPSSTRAGIGSPGGPARPPCLLYTSDAADDLLCVDLGGRRIIKKKKDT